MSNNLLDKLKEALDNKDHILYGKINLEEDKKGFYFKSSSKEKTKLRVRGEKNNLPENVLREVVHISLTKNIEDYTYEAKNKSSDKPSDSTYIIDEKIADIREFKILEASNANKLNETIEKAFEQVKFNYIKPKSTEDLIKKIKFLWKEKNDFDAEISNQIEQSMYYSDVNLNKKNIEELIKNNISKIKLDDRLKQKLKDSIPSNEKITNGFSLFENGSYVSVIVGDIIKILESPENMALFRELEVNQLNKKKEKHYEELGLFIITKKIKYNETNELEFEEEDFFDLSTVTRFELKDKTLSNCSSIKEKVIVSNLLESIKLPTYSKVGGIQNVRRVYNPERDEEKQSLVNSILGTLLLNLKENESPDSEKESLYPWMSNEGKKKDFNFVKNETIINDINKNSFFVSSVNSSLIDGQNSIDSVNIIINFFKLIEEHKWNYVDIEEAIKKSNYKKTYASMLKTLIVHFNFKHEKEKIDEYNDNNNEKLDFKNIFNQRIKEAGYIKNVIPFLKNCYVEVSLNNSKNIKESSLIAKHKNTSIQVEKGDLDVSEHIDKVKVLSNELFNFKPSFNLNYPKKLNYLYPKDSFLIETYKLAAFCKNIEEYKKKLNQNENKLEVEDLEWSLIVSFAENRTKIFNIRSNNKSYIKNFLCKFLKEKESKEIKILKEKIAINDGNDLYENELKTWKTELSELEEIKINENNKKSLLFILNLLKLASEISNDSSIKKKDLLFSNIEEYAISYYLLIHKDTIKLLFKSDFNSEIDDDFKNKFSTFLERVKKVKEDFGDITTELFNGISSKEKEWENQQTSKIENSIKMEKKNKILRKLMFDD
jgi:hypothetical protein